MHHERWQKPEQSQNQEVKHNNKDSALAEEMASYCFMVS